MLVVGRPAAAQGDHAVRRLPARAGDDDVVAQAHIMQVSTRRLRRRFRPVPDRRRPVRQAPDIRRHMIGNWIAMSQAHPCGDSGVEAPRVAEVHGVLGIGGRRHGQADRIAHGARIIDELAIIDAQLPVQHVGEENHVHRRVAPVAGTLVVGAVESVHDRKGAGALPRQLEPLARVGMPALQRDAGKAEAADGDDLEVGGVEDQRPAPHIDREGHFLPRVLGPAAHAVGEFHAVERGVARRCTQGDDAAFNLGSFRFRQLVAQPVERQHAGDRRLGRALQADGLLPGLEEIIPALVFAQAFQRQFRDPQLGGVALQHVGQR